MRQLGREILYPVNLNGGMYTTVQFAQKTTLQFVQKTTVQFVQKTTVYIEQKTTAHFFVQKTRVQFVLLQQRKHNNLTNSMYLDQFDIQGRWWLEDLKIRLT